MPVAVRITSADSIRRAIKADVLLSSILDAVEVNETGKPPVSLGASCAVLVLPIIDGLEAIWSIRIIGLTQEEIRQVSSALQELFPAINIKSSISGLEGEIISLVTPTILQAVDDAKRKQEEAKRQKSIEEAVNYATNLRDGADGRDGARGDKGDKGDPGERGPMGPAGRDGRDLVATEAELNDLKDVFAPDPNVGHVLMWDGSTWVSRYLPQVYKYAGGGGGGIADAPSDGKAYVRQDGQWVELAVAAQGLGLDAGDFDS